MFCRWSDEIDVSIQSALDLNDMELLKNLKHKKRLYLSLALLAVVDEKHVLDKTCYCNLVVQRGLISSNDLVDTNIMKYLDLKVQSTINHISTEEWRDIVENHSNDLNVAVGHALNMNLSGQTWTPLITEKGYSTGCADTLINTEKPILISVSLISGETLVNGKPPSHLPLQVLRNPLYIRTFGNRKFDILGSADGAMSSFHSISNVFYNFQICDSEHLSVEELWNDRNNPDAKYNLIDLETEPFEWKLRLPLILRVNYSHWFTPSFGGCLVFRPKHFSKKEIFYFASNLESNPVLYEVPHGSYHLDIGTLVKRMSKFNFFLDPSNPKYCQFLSVLSKFDQMEFIHVLSSADSKSIIFSLPRFSLSFQYDVDRIDDLLVSRDQKGYALLNCQQLNGTLCGLSRYLILYSIDGKGENKVFIPDLASDHVSLAKEGYSVCINLSACTKLTFKYNIFDVHAHYNTLIAANISSRLQLAVLHLLTSSSVPDMLTIRTGSEMALSLLRQSWVNRKLTKCEWTSLNMIQNFVDPRKDCALMILLHDLKQTSAKFSYLYNVDDSKTDYFPPYDEKHSIAVTAYTTINRGITFGPRMFLNSDEEINLLGIAINARPSGMQSLVGWAPKYSETTEELPLFNFKVKSVDDYEKRLLGLMSESHGRMEQQFPFDENDPIFGTEIGHEMIKDLKESWKLYYSNSINVLNNSVDDTRRECGLISIEVVNERMALEEYLFNTVSNFYGNIKQQYCLRAMKSSNNIPLLTKSDLVQFVIDIQYMKNFNPLLSDSAIRVLWKLTIKWLQLCVLEIRLARIDAYLDANDVEQTIRELSIHRQWDPEAYPYWLAFEFDQRLQIRPEQYEMINYLIKHPGSIAQLNMGLGKTRVILPCLILYFSFTNKDKRVITVHLLNELFHEGFSYLHSVLCGTVLGRKLFVMPYSRNINLDNSKVNLLFDILERCSKAGGALILSPEHQLSLFLRKNESQLGQTCKLDKIQNIFSNFKFWNIFDESDEIFRFKKQLVYACGVQESVPSGCKRWSTAEYLVRLCRNDPKVLEILSDKSIATFKSDAERHEFNDLQLITGPELTQILPELNRALFKSFVKSVKNENHWFRNVSGALMDRIEEYCVDAKVFDSFEILNDFQKEDVLCLRAYLAHGLLAHCMEKRYLVNYGVADGHRKRIAVPFKAANTPDLRSEFAQPDCVLLLTVLSYYQSGLSMDQMLEAFKLLFQMGTNAQRFYYSSWLSSGDYQNIAASEYHTLNDICKVDLTNPTLTRVLYQFFRRNMLFVDFWLNNCLFIKEIGAFSKRMMASGWHLASFGEFNIGFSGTNDGSMMLPVMLKQKSICASLSATNGKMLSHILKKSHCLKILLSPESSSLETLMDIAIVHDFDALIDAGALVIGTLPDNLQTIMIEKLKNTRFRGIVFYDTVDKDWVVVDFFGEKWSLRNSPIPAADAFAFYDHSRCRGADLRLRGNAKALITVGPKLTKDALMQAAGRLRNLDYGQTMAFGVPAEIEGSIRQVSCKNADFKMEPKDILLWSMYNSIQSCIDGFSLWAYQGYHFYISSENARLILHDEVLDLENLYGSCVKKISAKDVSKNFKESMKARFERVQKYKFDTERLKELDLKVDKYGSDIHCINASFHEECEREIEKEQDKLEEVEIELPSVNAAEEVTWNYKTVYSIDKISQLDIEIISLHKFTEQFEELKNFVWCDKIFMTKNFAVTIKECKSQLTHLRPVDSMLFYPMDGNKILLLSEKEANYILNIALNMSEFSISNPIYINFSFLCGAKINAIKDQVPLQIPPESNEWIEGISDHTLASLQILAGRSAHVNLKGIEKIFSHAESRINAYKLAEVRALTHLIDKSDLQLFINSKLSNVTENSKTSIR